MNYAEDEPNPDDISPLRRYYSDISLDKTNFVDIFISLEKMYVNEGMIEGEVDSSFIINYINHIEENTHDVRVRKEQYLLLPIRYMGSLIDITRKPEEAYGWYKESVHFVEKYTEDVHSVNCLNGENRIGETGCVESEECPVRFIQTALTREACEPDFESLGYFMDQKRARAVTLNKLLLAKQRNYIAPHESMTILDSFVERFNTHFNIKAIKAKPEDVS